jgi:uncharacterized protein YbjT (DUF2867 family)
MTVLVVGATGSIGGIVVEEVVRKGHAVRALVRDSRKAWQTCRWRTSRSRYKTTRMP